MSSTANGTPTNLDAISPVYVFPQPLGPTMRTFAFGVVAFRRAASRSSPSSTMACLSALASLR
jgi:hypothetical protein